MRWTLGGSSGIRVGRWARIAGLCCIVLLAALMPAAQAEVAPQEVDVTLGYGCQLAPGPRQVSIRVGATFPGAGVAGHAIQPKNVTVRVTLPPATVADLTEQGAATVAGAIDLGAKVVQNGKSSDSAWTGLAAPSAPLPETGELTLVASGPVPPATVTAPGDVRFTAGLIGITLTPKQADGSATDPPSMPLACTLNPGEAAHLVTVPVSEGSASTASPTASNAPETTSPQDDRARGIITGPGANSQAQIGGSPYDYINIPAIELCLDRFWATPQFRGRMQAYLAGYSNAKKLNSALTAGYPVPALVKGEGVATGRGLGFPHTVRTPDGHQYVCPSFEVDLDYQGRMELPPARATFLAFGFMPVTATAHISQVDREPLTGVVYRKSGASQQFVNAAEPFDIFTMAKMSLRLSDVTVNGVPLDVGSNCRTTEHLTSPDSPYRPDRLVMLGGSRENSPRPKFSYILSGGAMSGTVSIPNFTGCVTPSGEDLAPLLDATVSGDGNFMKMVLGPVCDGSNSVADFCMSPTDFRPSRVPYLYVSNGGPFSSTSEVTIESSGSSPLRITCPSVVASGAVPDASGPPRDSLGTLHLTFPPECAGSDGSRWQVSMQGTAHMAASWYNPAAKATNGKITDVSLLLSGTNVSGGGSCAAVTGGANLLTYTNPPEALLTLVAGARLQVGGAVLSDNCPGYFRSSSGSPANFYMSGVFDLKPANITVTSPHASEVVGP